MLVSVINPDNLRLTLKEFFDEAAFLSPHGLRAVSKRYEGNPYTLDGVPGATIDYEPAESTTSMFGGNSNWRGPVWLPVNYLAIRQFVIYQRFFGDDFKLEYPTGSGGSTRSGRSHRTWPTGSSRSGCRAPTAAGRSTGRPSGCRPIRPGRRTSPSTSTSTATTAPASAPRTRPAGRPSSPT